MSYDKYLIPCTTSYRGHPPLPAVTDIFPRFSAFVRLPCVSKLEYLEAQLGEGDCDVEGWLLLAMHRLPRRENSAGAVLDTVEVSGGKIFGRV